VGEALLEGAAAPQAVEMKHPRTLGDPIVDIVKGLLTRVDSRAPDGAMDGAGAAALPEPDERARMAVVIVANVRDVERGHGQPTA
jgi:hypothetical protein